MPSTSVQCLAFPPSHLALLGPSSHPCALAAHRRPSQLLLMTWVAAISARGVVLPHRCQVAYSLDSPAERKTGLLGARAKDPGSSMQRGVYQLLFLFPFFFFFQRHILISGPSSPLAVHPSRALFTSYATDALATYRAAEAPVQYHFQPYLRSLRWLPPAVSQSVAALDAGLLHRVSAGGPSQYMFETRPIWPQVVYLSLKKKIICRSLVGRRPPWRRCLSACFDKGAVVIFNIEGHIGAESYLSSVLCCSRRRRFRMELGTSRHLSVYPSTTQKHVAPYAEGDSFNILPPCISSCSFSSPALSGFASC